MKQDPPANDIFDAATVGDNIRTLRRELGVTLTAMSQQLGISPSALSQIERGKMRPSVNRLYQIVTLLQVPLDAVFGNGRSASDGAQPAGDYASPTTFQSVDSRSFIELEQGITWARINPLPIPGLEILEVAYPAGAVSDANGEFLRHSGQEVGFVIRGSLKVEVAFTSYTVGVGDSLLIDSSAPHRITNVSNYTTTALWVTITPPSG